MEIRRISEEVRLGGLRINRTRGEGIFFGELGLLTFRRHAETGSMLSMVTQDYTEGQLGPKRRTSVAIDTQYGIVDTPIKLVFQRRGHLHIAVFIDAPREIVVTRSELLDFL